MDTTRLSPTPTPGLIHLLTNIRVQLIAKLINIARLLFPEQLGLLFPH
jgi:hypothetical protein